MKSRKFFELVFCLLAFVGCTTNEYVDSFEECTMLNENLAFSRSNMKNGPVLFDRLDRLRDSTPQILRENEIKFLGYEWQGILSSSFSTQEIKQMLLDDETYFPIQNVNEKTLSILKKEDILANDKYLNYYNFNNLIGVLDTLVKGNLYVVKLFWEYKGDGIESWCLLDENCNFKYDNILSHVLIVDEQMIFLEGGTEYPNEEKLDSVSYKLIRLKTVNSIIESGGSEGESGESGDGESGEGESGEDPIWKPMDVYKEVTYRATVTSLIGVAQATINFTHVAVGIGTDGVVDMLGSWVENVYIGGLSEKFTGKIEYRFVEQSTGVNGVSYLRVAYVIQMSNTLSIKWEGSYATIEGEVKQGYSAANITENKIFARSGGWLIGNREVE